MPWLFLFFLFLSSVPFAGCSSESATPDAAPDVAPDVADPLPPGPCVGRGAKCANGEMCCMGLTCCTGADIGAGDEFCELDCPAMPRRVRPGLPSTAPQPAQASPQMCRWERR
jgi:hypothetical protein